ncbi:polysaccharide lyase family protein [Scopulibacillus cellulosilyticus]|uniref:rhamnogalacturonan endolyase n=1 Tax=Scopulibacillus cellulosilyticus TaxID=2665665 RepID=A0ABW2Q0B8_9BACL
MGQSCLRFKKFKLVSLIAVIILLLGNLTVFHPVKAASKEKNDENVSLTVNGKNATLSNGLITIKFNSQGMVYSLIKNGQELVSHLDGAENDPDKKHTFYVDYHTKDGVKHLNVSKLKIIKHTANTAHIAYIDDTGELYLEYHIIMMKGKSGIYSYVVAKNNNKKSVSIEELRSIYRFDRDIFDYAYNSERTGQQPRYGYLETLPEVQDETWQLPNGNYYTKYDYAGYFSDNPVWGHYGHGFGAWFIPAGTEYYPGGPLKQDLLVHQDAIALNYMTSRHFGTGNLTVPPGWQKLYGPWFVYINAGSHQSVIKDANHQAKIEEAKWPYKWMNDPLYPTNRTKVTGRLHVTDGRSAAGAIVVLAQPGGDFYSQTTGYIFYGKADSHGNFTIPHVRPGKYSLYAYAANGTITDQLEKDNVEVKGPVKSLGTVNWSPAKNHFIHWQIGKSDRKAGEFKYGDKLRNYKWMGMTPADLTYTIGKSRDSKNWYYAQTKKGDWQVNFNLNKHYKGDADLTVALAAASNNPNIAVKVNGTTVNKLSYDNDQAIYRSANQSGHYHLEKIKFNAALLKKGKNTITFNLTNGGSVMYDAIMLDTDEPGDIATVRQLVKGFLSSEKLDHPLADQLEKRLDLAQHQLNNGDHRLAIKHLEDFKRLLNNRSLNTDGYESTKEILNTDLNAIIDKI